MRRHEPLPFDQISVAGMVYAYIIRSGKDIGAIRGIKTPPLPEGYSLITADQLPFHNELSIGDISIPLFATKTVSYRGEAVGLLIGPNPLIAEELATLTVVECEGGKEPRSDWHAFSSEHIAARVDYARHSSTERESGNERGPNPSQGDTAEEIFEHHSFLRIEPHPFEFHSGIGALAEWDYDKLKLACPTLWPEHVRTCVAKLMDAQVEDIEIIQMHMHDSSELYTWFPSLLAARATAAAWALKKPVKLLISPAREKHFLPYAHGISIHLATRWSKKHLRLLGADCRFAIPIGAYSIFAKLLIEKTARLALDSVPNAALSVTGIAVRTEAIPMGATECLSSAALYSLFEAHLAQAAREMDISVIELSQKVFSGNRQPDAGLKSQERELPALRIAQALLTRVDFYRKYAAYEQIFKRNPGGKEAKLRTLSFSLAYQDAQIHMPPLGQKAQIQITLDRNLKTVLESDVAYGSERLKQSLRQQIANSTKTPLSHVAVEAMQEPHLGAIPLISSAGIALVSDLVRRAEERIQRLHFREGLPLSVRTFSLIKQSERDAAPKRTASHPSIGSAILEVEYDTLTSTVQSIKLDISVNAGRILSLSSARSALRASCLEALRACLIGASQSRSTVSLYDTVLARSEINVSLVEDEKAAIARPIGNLAYSLTLSCFLGVIQQFESPRRLALPLRSASLTADVGARV